MSPVVLVCLRNDVAAFDMGGDVAAWLAADFPNLDVRLCPRYRELPAQLPDATFVVTWKFEAALYPAAPRLRAVFTPAAGGDWVQDDPAGRVAVHHGAFHGPMMAESLLGHLLDFNRAMPQVRANQAAKRWDRNAQGHCRLLKDQTVLIVGYGQIGRACAKALLPFGCRVLGLKRHVAAPRDDLGVELVAPAGLEVALGQADHVALILPGTPETDGFLSRERLRLMKRSAHLYNMGRGNAIKTADIVWAAENRLVAGMALDVFEVEPLPPDSPLWTLENVFVTPHADCVHANYREEFYRELKTRLAMVTCGSAAAGRESAGQAPRPCPSPR